MSQGYRTLLFFLLALASVGTAAYAQEASVTARVTYLAGQNVYLDAGRDRGILPGDTLAVYRAGALVGRLAVVSSISDRCVVTFAGAPFPLTLGNQLDLRGPSLRGEEAVAAPSVEAEPEPTPREVAPAQEEAYRAPEAAPPRRRPRAGPTATGRVLLSVNALQSSTRWTVGQGGTAKRTFVTPSLNVHATVVNLPQGVRLRTRLRADYRYTSGRAIEPTQSVRAYEALLEKDFSRFTVQAGRFANRYAAYGGFWDGALLHVGNRRAGFGTAVGFMPDRSNEGFSADMPRYAGFAHLELGDRSRLAYHATLSFNEIRPSGDLLTHSFAGLSQRLRRGGFSLRNDVQLDRDPETGQWRASRVHLRGAVASAGGVSLHGRYTIRRPYSIYRVQRVFSYRRDQAHAGLSLRLPGATVGADVAFNFVEGAAQRLVDDGRTVSGYVQAPRTGVLDLGFSAHASYWSDAGGSSFFVNTAFSRSVGAVRARAQYQFYRTETLADPLVTHAVVLHASAPLGGSFSTSTQVRLQQSATLGSAALYTSLWYTF